MDRVTVRGDIGGIGQTEFTHSYKSHVDHFIFKHALL